MRFVEHPGADLALLEHPPQRTTAQLLRRNDQHGNIAEPDAVEHIRTLGNRKKTVQRGTEQGIAWRRALVTGTPLCAECFFQISGL